MPCTLRSCLILIVLSLILFSCIGPVKKKHSANNMVKFAIEKPSGVVHCAQMDRDGNLWFGTIHDGLYKYDGTRFIHYNKMNGLPQNMISCIYQAQNGNLWFGTVNGISIFDGSNFSFLEIPNTQISTDWLQQSFPIVNPNEVQSINQDKDGFFWLGTNGAGAYRYDGHTFTNHLSEIGNKMPDSLYHNIIQSITKDHKGNLWFSSMSHGGISKYDGHAFTQYLPKDGLSDDMVRTSFQDSQDNLWIGFNGNRQSGLTYTDGNNFYSYTTEDGLCSKNIRAIYEDRAGNLWIGGMQGLCLFDGSTFTPFNDHKNRSYDRILFIIGDNDGNIWFGGIKGFWKYDGEKVYDMKRTNK